MVGLEIGTKIGRVEVLGVGATESPDAYLARCGIENFKMAELMRSKIENYIIPDVRRSWWRRIVGALGLAELFRAELGVPLTVAHGYRPREYNSMVRGSKKSRHIKFCALDLDLPRASSRELRREFAAIAVSRWLVDGGRLRMGLGIYSSPGVGRVHVDTGTVTRSWEWEHVDKVMRAITASATVTRADGESVESVARRAMGTQRCGT